MVFLICFKGKKMDRFEYIKSTNFCNMKEIMNQVQKTSDKGLEGTGFKAIRVFRMVLFTTTPSRGFETEISMETAWRLSANPRTAALCEGED